MKKYALLYVEVGDKIVYSKSDDAKVPQPVDIGPANRGIASMLIRTAKNLFEDDQPLRTREGIKPYRTNSGDMLGVGDPAIYRYRVKFSKETRKFGVVKRKEEVVGEIKAVVYSFRLSRPVKYTIKTVGGNVEREASTLNYVVLTAEVSGKESYAVAYFLGDRYKPDECITPLVEKFARILKKRLNYASVSVRHVE